MSAARDMLAHEAECQCDWCGGWVSVDELQNAHELFGGTACGDICNACAAEEEKARDDADDECSRCRGGFCSSCTDTGFRGTY